MMDIILNFFDNFILIMCIPIITILILNKTSNDSYYQEGGTVLTSASYISKVRYLLFLNFIILMSWSFFFIILKLSFDEIQILKISQVLFMWFIAFGFLIEARKNYPHAPHSFLKELELYKK